MWSELALRTAFYHTFCTLLVSPSAGCGSSLGGVTKRPFPEPRTVPFGLASVSR